MVGLVHVRDIDDRTTVRLGFDVEPCCDGHHVGRLDGPVHFGGGVR